MLAHHQFGHLGLDGLGGMFGRSGIIEIASRMFGYSQYSPEGG
ncbi:hypothetical protein L479_01800 [Exiguobacterium sp. S17]|nr:hypothetical protein L479_01800 [Exiguobacterium sp. S17]